MTKRPLTAAEMAALDFEPMCAEDHEACKPPSNDEWTELANPHLVIWRLAWIILGKTKPQLVEMMREIDKDDEVAKQTMDGFLGAISFFEAALDVLRRAEARILCAGSVLEIEDGEPQGLTDAETSALLSDPAIAAELDKIG